MQIVLNEFELRTNKEGVGEKVVYYRKEILLRRIEKLREYRKDLQRVTFLRQR
jgi:hypothetical protein